MSNTEPDTPPTPTDTLYSCADAIGGHEPVDRERIVRALAAFFGVDLVQVVEEQPR